MNKRTIIIASFLIIFLALGFYFLDFSKVEYSTISDSKKSGKKSQIIGSAIKDSIKFDKDQGLLIFPFVDKQGLRAIIKYSGAPPSGFESAEQIVVKGSFNRDTLEAEEILTKCPSKYENK